MTGIKGRGSRRGQLKPTTRSVAGMESRAVLLSVRGGASLFQNLASFWNIPDDLDFRFSSLEPDASVAQKIIEVDLPRQKQAKKNDNTGPC